MLGCPERRLEQERAQRDLEIVIGALEIGRDAGDGGSVRIGRDELAGAGIVADSDPAAEYDETPAKSAGFIHALGGRAVSGRARMRSSTSSPS